MEKFLTVDADKCTGCRLCEQVCSVMHEGVSNPAQSRIQVVKREQEPAEKKYLHTLTEKIQNNANQVSFF